MGEMDAEAVIPDVRLRQCKLFNDVDIDIIRPLLALCSTQLLKPGDILLRPECVNNCMFVVLSGKVAVYLESLDTPPLTTLGTGECVGEMSVFDGHNPSAYVRAITACEVMVIHEGILWQLIDSSHGLSRNLLHLLSHRLRSGNHIVTLSKTRAREQEHEAKSDALTGIKNRRWLDETLTRIQGRDLISMLPMAVLMVDVDRFKAYNDTYGHKAGDVVLQLVAATISHSLRPSDMVARYGGEEFVALLPRTPEEQAKTIAERLRGAVEVCEIFLDEKEDPLPPVTISIGIAPLRSGESMGKAIEAADQALYRAKDLGRNRYALRD